MSRPLTAALLGCLLCLTACNHSYMEVEGPEQIPTKLEVGKPAAGEVVIGTPISLPGSDHALLPVTLEHLKAWFEPDPYYGYSASDSVDYSLRDPYRYLQAEMVSWRIHWHNVIFHDQQTDETHILLDRPAVISRYQIIGQPPKDKDDTYRIDCLLFSISDSDTNKDGLIDADDAVVVYACDVDGSNLRRITPEGSMLLRVNYVPKQRLMYLATIADTNQDGEYTTHDERTLLSYRVTDPGPGQPVLDQNLIDQAKRFLNAD